ncbi:deoxyguanosinetriphosphate triphosphohydrolase family protein [Modestobacter sp. VKM Ac-2985]|uniref:deoxyguanosinetriphosphate triphosphohydrolase family protein n=1 Tax=Modestobacter sp. VKM Ac-2985 TaxID=3004139 RepID=UPI0022ABABA6|nr:dNTP triphosphohydrolase [Modestobacter sp. VKM Ac-2985]MCZ2838215.1 dNTP triphosphohydrolase [Modestobacter sp. VKM Ac-2985]
MTEGSPHDEASTPDKRSDTEHDADRVLYSDGFRRLGGVTQVVAVGEMPLFHNRLTHTLKVAQIARRLAQHLSRADGSEAKLAPWGGIDVPAAEAAGLGHDLGHPPFGHVGETVLNERCEKHGLDGFEGNAQTFRLVTKLLRGGNYATPGLDLQARTLNGLIKYPRLRPEGQTGSHFKWNAYPTERRAFDDAREGSEEGAKSLEAAVMDWADDVTYAVHDLEDFLRAGRVPIARLLDPDGREMTRFVAAATNQLSPRDSSFDPERAEESFRFVGKTFLSRSKYYRGTAGDLAALQQASGEMINSFIGAVRVGDLHEPVRVPSQTLYAVKMLKQLPWYYVIHDPALATMQEGNRRLVGELFDDLLEWLPRAHADREPYRIPKRLLDLWSASEEEVGNETYLDETARAARCVADYIAMLTEAQAIDMHGRLRGRTGQSALDSWMAY